MPVKLYTVKEVIERFEKLPEDTVLTVKYNQWLHNQPAGKVQFTISLADAESMDLIKSEHNANGILKQVKLQETLIKELTHDLTGNKLYISELEDANARLEEMVKELKKDRLEYITNQQDWGCLIEENTGLKLENTGLTLENEELKKQIESKERVIKSYEQYINDLKEDGVLDD